MMLMMKGEEEDSLSHIRTVVASCPVNAAAAATAVVFLGCLAGC